MMYSLLLLLLLVASRSRHACIQCAGREELEAKDGLAGCVDLGDGLANGHGKRVGSVLELRGDVRLQEELEALLEFFRDRQRLHGIGPRRHGDHTRLEMYFIAQHEAIPETKGSLP